MNAVLENPTVILLLRGHVRNSFQDDKLLDFMYKMCTLYNVHIHIHTWNVYSSQLSWRDISNNNEAVSEDCILSYFQDIPYKSMKITVEDDARIQLQGDTSGNVFDTLLPKLAWKRMWYGVHKAMQSISTQDVSDSMVVINTRFDLFNNSNSFTSFHPLLNLIHSVIKDTASYKTNWFLNDSTNLLGIDNFYVGSVATMNTLVTHFHTNLDHLCDLYPNLKYQEASVYYENMRLFDPSFSLPFPNIDMYCNKSRITKRKPWMELVQNIEYPTMFDGNIVPLGTSAVRNKPSMGMHMQF